MRHRRWTALGSSNIPAILISSMAAAAPFLVNFTAFAALAQEAREFSTQTGTVLVETLASGLEHPWAVEAMPDGALIVTERPGRLRILRDGKLSDAIKGVPTVAAHGQGGLLDVALDRQFATNRTIYLTLSARGEGGYGTALVRAALSQDGRSLTDAKEIFRMNRFTRKGQHFGSRIAIDKDGSLFFGIGDRGEGERAQDPHDHAGSVLHINADGSIPASNPFRGGTGGLAEIWSTGHRNPQGITFDPEDGKLLTVEHGARGGDEVNNPQPGRNYGWPVITFGKDYSGVEIGEGTAKEGLEQPLFYWDPSIAPGAIAVYRGSMFPEWNGDLLIAALKYQLLTRLDRDETGTVTAEERLFDGEFGRIRDVIVAPDGALIMVTDEEDGEVLRVSKAPTQ
ncbi:PQQ-dependent sugar dehydrogenase [Sinorhizobium medicae]|uniref:Glucose/Sorbosone dehydrogenase domain-containing protein n=2 Tax=Sinorhizobium medicae TaxID=110321 RepID=A0A508WZH7_9HYPH|nr:PQQ-dependent sugar dehydrogenase [Sinorhizobium medicae]ABR61068.1 glucose sorbosone dehydrogenase [Sinorhizobium medicae WSM419]MBO1943558.1 PQQ-dependent sugar dehydrogenase [Sinorhizobium medicae]MBO1959230.1 PQQ-dependent sugar dehydrogenase [Sinorhizobium medicae]MDX0405556.1 PQQ-dependent sugar dehydrogenase [Sinorhizobium medicae]MDX0411076.1 PQQ-dependent sugar dehydrogenase [Sinorhizobium medicae]